MDQRKRYGAGMRLAFAIGLMGAGVVTGGGLVTIALWLARWAR